MKTIQFFPSRISLILLFLFASLSIAFAQKNLKNTDRSNLSGISLPSPGVKDERTLSVNAARSVLKSGFSNFDIPIFADSLTNLFSGVEVFALPRPALASDPGSLVDSLIGNLGKAGWKVNASSDPNYYLLNNGSEQVLMYISQGKKQTELYFGKLNLNPSGNNAKPIPRSTKPPRNFNGPQAMGVEFSESVIHPVIASWGNINSSKIHYLDSDTNAWMGSGLSTGTGIEFKEDGTFVQSFLALSSRPDYKIFVYTTGRYWVDSDTVTTGADSRRHYRKWEGNNLVSNEFSTPLQTKYIWRISPNQHTGVPCLILIDKADGIVKEYCKE